MRQMAERRRVPKVLWRLFRDKARTLARTIISLIPPLASSSATTCRCKGRRCLRCAHPNAISFILRRDDPPHYRRLLNCCFVVINDNAPPLIYFYPDSHCSQQEIVKRIIEMLLPEGSKSNVLCVDYNKHSRSSHIVDCLTCSAWDLLHERVGDDIMAYLLKSTSIFLPLCHNKHHQVSGPPVNELCLRLSKQKLDYQGPNKKRRGLDSVNPTLKRQKVSSPFILMPSPCLCCLALQFSCSVINKNEIDRRYMFYNVKHSSSLFTEKNMLNNLKPNFSGIKYQPAQTTKAQYMLNNLKPNFSGAKFLIGNIFGLSDMNINAQSMQCFHRDGFCTTGSTCLYHYLLKSLKVLIRRAKKCQYRRLLDKHCPDPSACLQAKKNSSSISDMTELGEKTCKKPGLFSSETCKRNGEVVNPWPNEVKPYCSKDQVVSFIWAVCRSIIPPDLLGTPSNQRITRKNINRFIGLRRFEKFSIKQCLHKLKTSRFAFLSKNNLSSCIFTQMLEDSSGQRINKCKKLDKLNNAIRNMKHNLLMNWIFWLFSCLIMSLVQSNFYVTESEQGKQEVYYYRKLMWENLTKRAIANLNDSSYICMDEATVRDIMDNRTFGFSKLRLLPKQNGVRMIANLKTSSRLPRQGSSLNARFCGTDKSAKLFNRKTKFEDLKSVNLVLRDTHAVLKGLLAKEPQKLGSSVFDYNDVYRKLCPFLVNLKDGSNNMSDIFIVVSDVSKAFDTIDQDKLLSVMDEIILEDEYHLEQSHQVICPKKSLWVRENLALSTDFTRVKSSVLFRSLHGVLINQGKGWYMKKEKLFYTLNELVKRNVLHLGNNFYLQGTGIPQGCVLSSLLCSLYYGHMDRTLIFPFLEKSCEATENLCTTYKAHDASAAQNKRGGTFSSCPSFILLRFIDDFLFVSTSKEQAARFFYRLQQGFGEYNCYMNKEKFCLNFDIGSQSGLSSSRSYVGEDGVSFIPWSGLLINCCTLEVQGDYRRYLNNHLNSTLTICWQGKPGRNLKTKLCGFMRPKCHPIFLDSNINSPAVVRLNVYQVFLLCAMKFHSYVAEISYIYKFTARFYLKIIERSIRYMNTLIKKRMQFIYLGPNLRPIRQLEKDEVQWLGLHAFVQVLKKKQSRHKALFSLLRSKLSAHRTRESLSCELMFAVHRSHSSLLWEIKY